MSDTFKPVVEGMEFHTIDGTGFPESVLVSNGGNVTDGTYIDKYYYPVVHAHWIEKVITDEYGNKISCVSCSNCGNYEKQNNTYYKTSSRFCSACGAKMDGDEHDNG